MNSQMQILKAYHVQGDEYSVIRFATKNVIARREGAQELEEEFNCVSCKRIPAADKYAIQGAVPTRALVEELGWWQECGYCGCHVDDETYDRVWDGDTAYCDIECQARLMNCRIDDEVESKREHDAEQAAIAVAEAKFPGITDVTAYTGNKKTITLYFRFPGGKERASWDLDGEFVGTNHIDVEPFKAYMASIRNEAQ